MDLIFGKVSRDRLKQVLTGVPIDLSKFPETSHDTLICIMAHCCLNGPVGVNKPTTFPGGVVGSIANLLPYAGKISNRQWSKLCANFAVLLKAEFPDIANACQQMEINHDLWPLWDKRDKS